LDLLLQVKKLKTAFYTEDGVVPAVNGISFDLRRGETVGLVGESGCGKSVTALSLLKLIPCPPGEVQAEKAIFSGRDLLSLREKEMRKIRGNDIAMIFQEPMNSLNPVYTIGNQLGEVFKLHRGLSDREAKRRSIDMLKLVGIPRAEKIVDEYPHSLSGGMRQRAMIAMALLCNPKLLIADEPTSALDVTIQAQILELMKELIANSDTAILFISHDLGVIAEMAERVMVMYAGKIVEEADAADLLKHPFHPYTIGLIKSKPNIDTDTDKLYFIPGQVPDQLNMPAGCVYHPRCDRVMDICRVKEPTETDAGPGRRISCWRFSQQKGECLP